ncbi:MAG: type 1 glutamine amidotransferase [Phycisphaeraceae bacterium]
MALIVFQHEPHEAPALLGQALQAHGCQLRTIKLFAGDAVPPDLDDVDGILILGGAANVDEADKHAWMNAELAYIKQAHDAGLPIVGICLGAQLIAAALGGKVAPMAKPEVGWKNIKLAFAGTTDPILAGIPWDTTQFHLHGQEVAALPAEGVPLAGSTMARLQAFRVGLTTYAFQYHFEWDAAAIATMSRDSLVTKAGEKSETIVDLAKNYLPPYRRLGDRLCENIATLLFAIDKR